MYEIDKRDRLIVLEGVPQSNTGAPLPVVLADDHHLLLGYITPTHDPNWDGSYSTTLDQHTPGLQIAIVQFDRPTAHYFGAPNVEALGGHPLAPRGLKPWAAFEVLESSWIRKLERMNSVHPRHNRAWFLEGKRHFLFSFNDRTFECIAKGYECQLVSGTLAEALDRMRGLLGESWK